MKNERGFTLFEIISCLAILSVLMGIGIPRLQEIISRQSFNAEVRRLVGEIHKARSVAIKSNTHVALHYSESGYTFFIDDGRGGGKKDDWIQQSGEEFLTNVMLSGNTKIATSECTFTGNRTRFSSRPGISAGSIVLQDKGGYKSKIVVNAIGRVRVEKL